MSTESNLTLSLGDALLIIDVQNDFLPGGALEVSDGDAIIPVLNLYIKRFTDKRLSIFASRDWHPPNHCSFQSQAGPWPSHCIADTTGAEFPAELELPQQTIIISKATSIKEDAYSAFQGTDLDRQLQQAGIQRLFIGGLATDYCVRLSVLDALKNSYQTFLLTDAIRAVNLDPKDGAQAEAEMIKKGAVAINLETLT